MSAHHVRIYFPTASLLVLSLSYIFINKMYIMSLFHNKNDKLELLFLVEQIGQRVK